MAAGGTIFETPGALPWWYRPERTMVDRASYPTRPSSPIVPTALVSHMLYILSLRLYTDLSFINYDSSIPSSRRPFTPPSIGLLGEGDGYEPTLSLAPPLISPENWSPGPGRHR